MGLALDEPQDNDDLVRVSSLDILVESRVRPFINHAVIDYIESGWGKGFSIRKGYGC